MKAFLALNLNPPEEIKIMITIKRRSYGLLTALPRLVDLPLVSVNK